MTPPFLSCLCPTYRRPRCLANVLACFLAQDYPRDRCELVILDDGGTYDGQAGENWRVETSRPRYASLPAKYNALAALADTRAEAFVVWEDDDVYLPGHLTLHGRRLNEAAWCHPGRVFSNYPGHLSRRRAGQALLQEEVGHGRFHGGWSFRRDHFEAVGGYPETLDLSFDQQMGARLSRGRSPWWSARGGCPADPTAGADPTYVFRWSNGYYHGQAAGDDFWRACAGEGDPCWVGRLAPQMDAETELVYRSLASAPARSAASPCS